MESCAGNTGTSNSIVTSASNNLINLNIKNNNKENQTVTEQMASVPLSAAQLVSQQVNSVIQTAHQPSVIQSPGTVNAAQAIQATKNALLLNKLGHSSVIHSTETSTASSQSQLVNPRPSDPDESPLICTSAEEESKKRREVLARRPSYRKILNELSSAETGSICTLDSVKSEPSDSPLSQASPSLAHLTHLQQQSSPGPPPPPPPVSIGSVAVSQSALAAAAAIAAHNSIQGSGGSNTDQNNNDTSSDSQLSGAQLLSVNPYIKVLPSGGMQLPTSGPDLLQHGLGLGSTGNSGGVAVSAPSALSSLHAQQQNAGIVQYAQSPDAQFFVPDMAWPYRGDEHLQQFDLDDSSLMDHQNLQAYQLRSAQMSPSVVISPNSSGNHPQHHVAEEAAKKRELRLLKNREAAKECRRKKKEYIKCLENRVAVLETQNKALIDELKSLKELYCQKNE